MNRIIALVTALVAIFVGVSYAAEDHAEKHTDEAHAEEHGHSDESEHEHGEGEEEEEGGNVGPDKGITEASERSGFKLSPEAMKNFDLRFMKLTSDGPWTLPKSALVHSGEEVNLFRFRTGFFKRIDFKTLRRSSTELTVDSDDMREGDEIVLVGMGFLRVAELAAFGGVAHGHSH